MSETTQTERYVTRREGVALVREQLNIPLTMGRVNKDSADGIGPVAVGKYGPRDMYTPEEFLRYARDRIAKRNEA